MRCMLSAATCSMLRRSEQRSIGRRCSDLDVPSQRAHRADAALAATNVLCFALDAGVFIPVKSVAAGSCRLIVSIVGGTALCGASTLQYRVGRVVKAPVGLPCRGVPQ